MKVERKQIKHIRDFKSNLQTRDDDNNPKIEGYFAVFNQETELWAGAYEKISRTAFDGQTDADVRALINHDTTLVLGRTTAGTLRLRTDDKGLFGEIDINPKDTEAMNLYERVKRGDVNQCSFGFEIEKEESDFRDDGSVHWEIKAVKLYEVSACTFPAYAATGIEARKNELEEHKERKLVVWKRGMKERISNVKTNNAE